MDLKPRHRFLLLVDCPEFADQAVHMPVTETQIPPHLPKIFAAPNRGELAKAAEIGADDSVAAAQQEHFNQSILDGGGTTAGRRHITLWKRDDMAAIVPGQQSLNLVVVSGKKNWPLFHRFADGGDKAA